MRLMRQANISANPSYPTSLGYGDLAIANNGIPAFGDKSGVPVILLIESQIVGANSNIRLGNIKTFAGTGNILLGSSVGINVGSAASNNVGIGKQALWTLNSGGNNVSIGYLSAYGLTSGNDNVNIGKYSGFNSGMGNRNVLIGAGTQTRGVFSGNDNIFIGSDIGLANNADGNPQNLILIGTGAGTNVTLERSPENRTVIGNINTKSFFAHGVYEATAVTSANVVTNSLGQVLRATSSKKHKKNIEQIEQEYVNNFLDNVNPVWFRSLCELDNPNHSHWGYIAEELASIDPRMVIWDYDEDSFEIIEDEIIVTAKEKHKTLVDGNGDPLLVDVDNKEIVKQRTLKEDATKCPVGVNTNAIVAMLTKIVQEQQKTIESMQKDIMELKKHDNVDL